MSFTLLLTLLFTTVVTSKPTPHTFNRHSSLDKRQDASSAPDPNICGEIVNATNYGYTVFFASDAYDCLISVPFNPAVALRFIEYYNTTLQFQSTVAYLKNPPNGYQQPPVDVFATLANLEAKVNSGFYNNEYAFEQDVQLLTYAMHDGHVDLTAGILSAFSFASPYYISSVSVDGVKAPEIFFTGDVIDSQTQGWKPSPIVTINGEEVISFLTSFAALQAVGTLEPHADWNQLMASPAQDIQGLTNTFGGGATFYPGDALNFTLANGSIVETFWLAFYDNTDFTGPLETGGDFYNYFVLGLLPASYNESLAAFEAIESPTNTSRSDPGASPTTSGSVSGAIMTALNGGPAEPTTPSWSADSSGAYPNITDISQPGLSIFGGGIVTGYFLEDVATAVLSIPSFAQFDVNLDDFTNTIGFFIGNATEKKIPKVIIDLQGNFGGSVGLAIETFKRFFPIVDVYGGSRRRNHALENSLGEITTDWYAQLDPQDSADVDLHYQFASDEWVVTNLINAETGQTFKSWSEFNVPQHYNNDTFSLTERYNLSDPIFNNVAFDEDFPVGYGPDSLSPPAQPWPSNSIVLLTDGLCSSACTLFVEMMTHQAGVQVIVMGGRPAAPNPMQAASGGRGAVLYDAGTLDDDFSFALAQQVNETTNQTLPLVRDPGVFTNWMGFNLRDQIRQNDAEPLQFKYLAADCRLYYTLANVYNMSRLWRDVATTNWVNRSLCVPGSQGYAFTGNTSISETPLPKEPPTPPNIQIVLPEPSWATNDTVLADSSDDGLQDKTQVARASGLITRCINDISCSNTNSKCLPINVLCQSSEAAIPVQVCLPRCRLKTGCDDPNTYCKADTTEQTKLNTFGKSFEDGSGLSIGQNANSLGLCVPTSKNYPGRVRLGCSSNS